MYHRSTEGQQGRTDGHQCRYTKGQQGRTEGQQCRCTKGLYGGTAVGVPRVYTQCTEGQLSVYAIGSPSVSAPVGTLDGLLLQAACSETEHNQQASTLACWLLIRLITALVVAAIM